MEKVKNISTQNNGKKTAPKMHSLKHLNRFFSTDKNRRLIYNCVMVMVYVQGSQKLKMHSKYSV